MATARKDSIIELHGDSTNTEVYCGILKLFVPTFVARLAWIGMKTTDTALLGHSGTDFLTASSLSDFWTSIWGVFISDSVLGSKCGQAYGAKNYEAVGVWLQVSWTVFSWILIPVFMLWSITGPVLQYGLDTNADIAGYAGYYAIVLGLCLPARLISGKLSTFFSSQKIMGPSSQTTPMALILNLVFGLQFVLGIPFADYKYGFWACPIVTTLVEWFLVLVYVVYYCGYCGYHDKCWPTGWSPLRDIFLAPLLSCGSGASERFAYYNKEIKPKMWEFIKLAAPSTLAIGSDFWRMSAIGLYSGTLGTNSVAVFNSSYRIAWMNTVIIGSFSSACATQLSIALGLGDGKLCKRVRNIGISIVFLFLFITVAASVVFIEDLARVFSSDPEVIQLYVECKWGMALMIFFMCFSMHFESLLYALQKTDTVFYAAVAGSWLGQVPAVVLLCKFQGRVLTSVYLGVGAGYALLLVLYMIPLLQVDMDKAAEDAHAKNKQKEPLLA